MFVFLLSSVAINSNYNRNVLKYWKEKWRPDHFACTNIKRIGNSGDGGKITCLDTPSTEKKCLIYSVGSNNDFSFENDIHTIYPNCEIHTFDPTVKFPQNPSFVHFHQTFVKKNGQEDIFILKMDCEGCEYTDLEYFIHRSNQILLEVHPCITKSTVKDDMLLNKINFSHTLFSREHNAFGVRPGCMELSWIKTKTPKES